MNYYLLKVSICLKRGRGVKLPSMIHVVTKEKACSKCYALLVLLKFK